MKRADTSRDVGKTYGNWLVLPGSAKILNEATHLWCECKCGNREWRKRCELIMCLNKSCKKCFVRPSTHMGTGTKSYHRWSSMIQRCTNPKNHGYKNYGGRGIKVCARWMNYSLYLEDVGNCPKKGLSVDRINNDGDYEPGNVRWATKSQQILNNRRAKLITAGGETRHVSEWSKMAGGARPHLVSWRIKAGWPVELAALTPVWRSLSTAQQITISSLIRRDRSRLRAGLKGGMQ